MRNKLIYLIIISTVLVTVAVSGFLATDWLSDSVKQRFRQDFLHHVKLAVGGFDPAALAETVASGDIAEQQCTQLWNRLESIRQTIPQLQYAYLMYHDGQDIRFLADTGTPGCDFSGPDGVYQEASPELHQLFTRGEAFVEGPLADRWGEWVSALAPVIDPQSGKVLAVLGLDVDAADYYREVAVYQWAGAITTLLVDVLFLLSCLLTLRVKNAGYRLVRLNRELEKGIEERNLIEKEQAEQVLLLQSLIDAIPAPVIYKDSQGLYQGCNRYFELATSVSRQDIVGRDINEIYADLLPQEQLDDLNRKYQQLVEKGPHGTLAYETVLRFVDGRLRHVAAHMANFPDADGGLGGTVGIFLDITAQKALEKDLLQSETRFRSIFNNASAGVVVVDEHGRFQQVNPAYCRLIGYTDVELLQMDYSQVTFADDLQMAKQLYQEAMTNRSSHFEIKKRLRCKDNRVVWVNLTGSWVYDETGIPLYAVVLVFDISEAKRAVDELRAQKDLLNTIIDHVPAAIFWKHRDLTYAGCNQLLADLAGFASPAEMIGKTDYDMAWKKEEADFFRECDRKVMDSGRPMLNIEEPQLQADGKEAILLTSKVPLTDPAGEVVGILGVFSDITDRRQAQEALYAEQQRAALVLKQSKEQTEKAFRSKSAFVANLGYEIRTPMNSILGMTELVLDGPLRQDQREHLEMARASARSLLELLNSLFDYTMIDNGELTLEQVDFDLDLLLHTIVSAVEKNAQLKGLQLQADIDSGLQGCFRGDPVRLKHVLSSLLGNAVKHTVSGSVRFQAREIDNSSNILFSVCDTGSGIAADKLAQLLEGNHDDNPFSEQRLATGGLDLLFCKQLVEAMGGVLQVESQVAKGSGFHLRLPILRCAKSCSLPDRRQEKYLQLNDRNYAKKVLLVEDNQVNQKVAKNILEKDECQVVIAADGEQALAELRQQDFGLVLMDLQMPKLDGLEATRLIRAGGAGESNRSLPIVALTAHAMAGDRDCCLAAGMDDYLSKPFDSAQLLGIVAQFFPSDVEIRKQHVFNRTATDTLDYESALKRLGGDHELLHEGFEAFITSAEEQLKRLREAIRKGDFQLIRREAHSYKGAAALIGAKSVRETALHLEVAAGEKNIDKCMQLIPKLEKELYAVLDWLQGDSAGRRAE